MLEKVEAADERYRKVRVEIFMVAKFEKGDAVVETKVQKMMKNKYE